MGVGREGLDEGKGSGPREFEKCLAFRSVCGIGLCLSGCLSMGRTMSCAGFFDDDLNFFVCEATAELFTDSPRLV